MKRKHNGFTEDAENSLKILKEVAVEVAVEIKVFEEDGKYRKPAKR